MEEKNKEITTPNNKDEKDLSDDEFLKKLEEMDNSSDKEDEETEEEKQKRLEEEQREFNKKKEEERKAKEAEEKGFVDTIIDGKCTAKAAFDLSIFANCPEYVTKDNNYQEPTEREIEKVLRDSGLSKNKAQAILAGGWKAVSAQNEAEVEACQKVIKIIKGGI